MRSGRKEDRDTQRQMRFIDEPVRTVDGEVHIKKYLLLQLVGSGSYSKCYLVKNVDSDSTYVVKIIPKKKLQILQKQKLIYEIKIHQSLSHENVVHLDHWFEDDNNQYIFMEYCANGNLEKKLADTEGSMKQSDIRVYIKQIVHAIRYIHSQNILHRDLKLCNFYLDANNQIKLGDFGFACQLASEYDRKRQTCGTPNYIAPQAISGFGYSYSSDVWAIGVILYRLRYGSCPFEGQTVKRTLENVKVCNHSFPSKPKITPQLKDLIQKIFNLNYDERLTIDEILNHQFFQSQSQKKSQNRQLKDQKRGFSLSRLFSRDKPVKQSKDNGKNSKDNDRDSKDTTKTPQKKSRQGIMERQSKTGSNNKKDEPKRSNSCQTFKQIKQIFKNKNKQNLIIGNNHTTEQKKDLSSPYYTMNTISNANREKDTGMAKTNRASVMQYSYSMTLNQTMESSSGKKQQNSRSNRLNQFIKNQLNSSSLKQQLKVNKIQSIKCTLKISKQEQNGPNKEIALQNQMVQQISNKKNLTNTNFINSQKIVKPPHNQQILINYCRRYYLPGWIQQEKDLTVIHFKSTLKQIIHLGIGYVLYRGRKTIYNINGEVIPILSLPKVVKYVIQNKIQVKQHEPAEEYQYSETDIMKVINYIPQNWLVLRQGIILRYGQHLSVNVAKLYTQQGFYLLDDQGQNMMYTIDSQNIPKLIQGVVIMRIYSGWVKANIKK